MKKAILGTKLGMSANLHGRRQTRSVTVIQAEPNVVVQKKTAETDGYDAVQVGYLNKREKLANKPEKGHFAKANVPVKRFLREFKLDNAAELNVGDELAVTSFEVGDRIDVTGISKGKGFAGSIKRHGQTLVRRATARVTTEAPAPWARAPTRRRFVRARSSRAIWVLSVLRFRTSIS